MSAENVRGFLAIAAAANRGDVDGVLRLTDPEIDLVPLRAPVQGSYSGHEGIRQFMADNEETFETFEVDYPDVRDLGDQVLALGTLRIRGKGSGAETEVPSTILCTFRDGLAVRFKDYGDRAQALEAAGLSE